MSALLKIVQGPNAGAEIALPDGVEVTLGKADTCDIVLADPTLPDASMTLSATPGGVLLDGTPLEPFHVHLTGSTALAVGPADAAWSELVWPSSSGSAGGPPADSSSEPTASPSTGGAGGPPAVPPTTPATPTPTAPKAPKNPKKSRLLVSLAILLLLALLLALLVGHCSRAATRTREQQAAAEAARAAREQALSDLTARYHLTVDQPESRRPTFTGNFPTRAERLEATARLYEAFPGAALDLTDNETLRTAVSDALLVIGETTLSVDTVTDRAVTLSGTTATPATLSAAIDAIHADVPRITDVIASAVTFRSPGTPTPAADTEAAALTRRRAARNAAAANPTLPVCGILATPYPCLVLRSGARVFPGATLGGAVVQSIAPDSVVLATTNGTFTWKP